MDIESLTPEQVEMARACKTVDEVAELAKSIGVNLTDEQLDSISGGDWNDTSCSDYNCPHDGCTRWG